MQSGEQTKLLLLLLQSKKKEKEDPKPFFSLLQTHSSHRRPSQGTRGSTNSGENLQYLFLENVPETRGLTDAALFLQHCFSDYYELSATFHSCRGILSQPSYT